MTGTTSGDTFLRRRSRFAATLTELAFDAAAITSLPNVRYLTGFTGSNAILLWLGGKFHFLTDPRYTVMAADQTGLKVRTVKGALVLEAVKLIARTKPQALGFENTRISYAQAASLEKKRPPQTSLKPLDTLLEQCRMTKDAGEIAAIRQAVLTNSKAFERVVAKLKPTMTEQQVALEIEYQQRKLGAEKSAFDTIVASGEHAALPHAQPRAQTIGTDQLLLIDMGATQDGYASDMTRVVHLGRPSARTKTLYQAVLDAQLAGIDAIRPGVTAGSVDRATRKVLAKQDLDRYFVHSTGHGLGLEIHEAPRLGRSDQTRLEEGMVITVEPGVYLPGETGIRIEDTVLVTANGCEILTPTSKELRVL